MLGASGQTGRRIAAGLQARGAGVRTATRSAELAGSTDHVRFDWSDAATHAAALQGIDAAYLLAPESVADPAPLMLPFIERALAAGVRRLVLLGSSAIPDEGPGLGAVARALRAQAPEWAVLQPSWFMQNFFNRGHLHGASLWRDGEVMTATGRGRVGFVDADDIAAVAVHALLDERAYNQGLVLTGPEALSYDDVCAILSRAAGRRFVHRPVSEAEAQRQLVASGIPERYAALLVALDVAIRDGAEDRVTDTVLRVTGRAPRSFAALAARELAQGGEARPPRQQT